jgi:hypothetical protein
MYIYLLNVCKNKEQMMYTTLLRAAGGSINSRDYFVPEA